MADTTLTDISLRDKISLVSIADEQLNILQSYIDMPESFERKLMNMALYGVGESFIKKLKYPLYNKVKKISEQNDHNQLNYYNKRLTITSQEVVYLYKAIVSCRDIVSDHEKARFDVILPILHKTLI
tara:strand:+ start:1641 stop:2021 length:381 start_codon:yes stop_codon:yes gene_type:complete